MLGLGGRRGELGRGGGPLGRRAVRGEGGRLDEPVRPALVEEMRVVDENVWP